VITVGFLFSSLITDVKNGLIQILTPSKDILGLNRDVEIEEQKKEN